MTWLKRIKSQMKNLGMTQEMLAKKMGITRGAITHYLAGRRVPPLKQFQKLADILNTDAAWLQFGSAHETRPIKEEALIIKHSPIPLLSWEQVAKLRDIEKIKKDDILEWIPHFYTDKMPRFGLRIIGDAMISAAGEKKSFHPGDIIIIDPETKVQAGSFVIALLPRAKEATFKQYIIDGGVHYLRPLNLQYPIIKIDNKTKIIGVVVSLFSVIM